MIQKSGIVRGILFYKNQFISLMNSNITYMFKYVNKERWKRETKIKFLLSLLFVNI
jgi:hypothetical protein